MKSPRKEGKPAEDSLSSSPCKKRCLPNDANESSATKKKKSAMPDVATKLGYNEGDRIEVYWKRGIDDNSCISQWWCAKLLPHDGRCLNNDSEENKEDNNTAIRVLEYDAYPAGGFPTTTRQDVIFVASNVLISFGQEERRLLFRREGSKEEFGEEKITADDVIWFDEDGLRIEIDSAIMGALNKHSKKMGSNTSIPKSSHSRNDCNQERAIAKRVIRSWWRG